MLAPSCLNIDDGLMREAERTADVIQKGGLVNRKVITS
jgi:hypothetical protein